MGFFVAMRFFLYELEISNSCEQMSNSSKSSFFGNTLATILYVESIQSQKNHEICFAIGAKGAIFVVGGEGAGFFFVSRSFGQVGWTFLYSITGFF